MSEPVLADLGCRVDAWDAEAMRTPAARAGVGDAVVVNACAATQDAVRKARQEVRRIRREHPEARIVVTGCAAQVEPETSAALPEVSLVLGTAEKLRPGAWAGLAPARVGDVMPVRKTALHLSDGFGSRARARAAAQVHAGCDHPCTFCVIIFGRGNSRSVPTGMVVDQTGRLDTRASSGRSSPPRRRVFQASRAVATSWPRSCATCRALRGSASRRSPR